MPKVTRGTDDPPIVSGMEFVDVDRYDVISFCPDSLDASTPAQQVHAIVTMKPVGRRIGPPFVMRYHGVKSLDAHILALIEHRTWVFGRRDFHNEYPVQPSGPQKGTS